MSVQALADWDGSVQKLVAMKQNSLLLDLIRELHQYILGMSSNTTDNSVMQSDELEELQGLIERGELGLQESIELISSFAQVKMKLDLSTEAIEHKLSELRGGLDEEALREQVAQLAYLEEQMLEIDGRIKVISNRCQNEHKPREKALKASESSLRAEIDKLKPTIIQLEEELAALQASVN